MAKPRITRTEDEYTVTVSIPPTSKLVMVHYDDKPVLAIQPSKKGAKS